MVGRNEAWFHPKSQYLLPCFNPELRTRHKLDHTSKLGSKSDVLGRQSRNTLPRNRIDTDPAAERQGGHDRALCRGVVAFNVGTGIRFSEAELLGLSQRLVVVSATRRHRIENEVRRTIHDSRDLTHAITT